MPTLQAQIDDALRGALRAALGDEYAASDPLVRPASDPRFGDFQANLAMPLAKALRQKPRDVAQRVLEHVRADGLFEKLEIAGPGFINMTLTPEALAQQAATMLADESLGLPPAERPQTVVVDYSSPNVAKEMHVGHLRSTIIGDAIARVLEYQGHRVIRQNHLGDWGTQFGMLIEHLLETFPGRELTGDDFSIGDLNSFYQEAKQKFDADADFAQRARERVVKLQRGDAESHRLWEALRRESLQHFERAYRTLAVRLTDDDVKPESAYNDQLPGVIEALEEAGLLTESQGATVVFPEGFVDRQGEPLPMIVRKQDGGYLYATTDLAAARYRIDELGAERIIYVTDARQAQHFAMVFQTLRQAGWAAPEKVRLDHVAFGTILGPDRKPFKTREGDTVRLSDLLDEAERRAAAILAEKATDLSADERAAVAHVVGIGALKYGDLSNDRVKDYVFEWDRMLAFDGNTAPYLQYSYTRIRSIFRKGEVDPASIPPDAARVTNDAERALVLKLAQWPDAIEAVAESLQPHRLCTFLYELATAYHQFYERCPVLTAETEALKQSRLALCHAVARTLEKGLALLGIDVVERM